MEKRIFIAAAWPYANGSLHCGHVASLIGADIIARYHRLVGDEVLFVSGSDCHGTPIAVEADRQGSHPAEIANKYHAEFTKTLVGGLGFSYDLYTKTTTKNHRQVVQEIFLQLYKDGHVYTKTEELPYCNNCRRFLPDRYVEGECPVCHFKAARGDQCDECGSLLDPNQLLGIICKICRQTPEWRSSEHFFLRLSTFQEQLKVWVRRSNGWRINAKNFTINLLEQGLHDRAITRDIEWGISVPVKGYEEKCIYVWFEAVCGYLSASKEWAMMRGENDLWKKFWSDDDSVTHFYVHGKDNIPFHTLIWPSILLAYGGLHLPDRIISSEYLTLEKKQFSKSRHWAVLLPDFLDNFDPETLRYYLVANGPETSDSDFSWRDYRTRTNSELIGNFGNFIHRVLSFIKTNFPEGVELPDVLDKKGLEFLHAAEEGFVLVSKAIEEGRFRKGLKAIIELSEYGNRYINEAAPWATIKVNRAIAERDLAVAGQVIRNLAVLVSPYLPRTSERIKQSVGDNLEEISWQFIASRSIPLIVGDLAPLYKRIEESDIGRQLAQLGKVSVVGERS